MNEIRSDMLAGEEFPPRQIGIDITNVMVEDQEQRAEKESRCAFREVPALILAFHRKKVGTRAHNKCVGCFKLHKTNQLERLAGHVRRCNELDQENRKAILEAYDRYMLFKKKSDKNTERNHDWVDVMVENNFSLASVGSKSFKRFIRENIPDWNIASRYQISDQYIPIRRTRVSLGREFPCRPLGTHPLFLLVLQRSLFVPKVDLTGECPVQI